MDVCKHGRVYSCMYVLTHQPCSAQLTWSPSMQHTTNQNKQNTESLRRDLAVHPVHTNNLCEHSRCQRRCKNTHAFSIRAVVDASAGSAWASATSPATTCVGLSEADWHTSPSYAMMSCKRTCKTCIAMYRKAGTHPTQALGLAVLQARVQQNSQS